MPERHAADCAPEHFRLHFYAAASHVFDLASHAAGSPEALVERFPFLDGYRREWRLFGCPDSHAASWWREVLARWEADRPGRLPIRGLRTAAGLDYAATLRLFAAGLSAEDPRFGPLAPYWLLERDAVEDLRALGLLEIANPAAARWEWRMEVPPAVWRLLRGGRRLNVPGMRYRPPEESPALESLVLPPDLPNLVDAEAVIVRGPRRNGRRALLSALARARGEGVVEIEGVSKPDDPRWRLLGPAAALLGAAPAIVLDPAPGETVEIPEPAVPSPHAGVVLGLKGGISGDLAERAVQVVLPMPPEAARATLWRRLLRSSECDAMAARLRTTTGNIHRIARLAEFWAAAENRAETALDDVRRAAASIGHEALDTLCARVPPAAGWHAIAVPEGTLTELRLLETRCRHRERIGNGAGAGVRALFRGPSGTGKTLAAAVLAKTLEKDLYRLDLSTVVNKYIGETEKNLNRAFSRAEELDVLLLLDEGDALLTRRTGVANANDRYANLETNYLLQRLESFEGILIVTTNAADRIDDAFLRRIDVVVDFPAPEAAERWAIWQMHLPSDHLVDPQLIDEIAHRCRLTGGQIRNAVQHAILLAADRACAVGSVEAVAAVRREYRKSGGVCPLRPAAFEATARHAG